MSPSDRTDSSDTEQRDESGVVYCRSCGTKAPSEWTYCRSCESSLDDAVPPEQRKELVTELYTKQSASDGDGGCPKCGHPEAEVELVETTGVAVTALIASQQNRFRVVSCQHCGYCEFYTKGDPDILLDLFLGE